MAPGHHADYCRNHDFLLSLLQSSPAIDLLDWRLHASQCLEHRGAWSGDQSDSQRSRSQEDQEETNNWFSLVLLTSCKSSLARRITHPRLKAPNCREQRGAWRWRAGRHRIRRSAARTLAHGRPARLTSRGIRSAARAVRRSRRGVQERGRARRGALPAPDRRRRVPARAAARNPRRRHGPRQDAPVDRLAAPPHAGRTPPGRLSRIGQAQLGARDRRRRAGRPRSW